MKYNQKNRRIHIGIWLFCALFSMVGILLFCGHTEKKASAADYDKLKQQIITAYQKYETSVNVKAYKLYNDTATSSKISSMFEEIMNETPYLFYNGRSFSKAIEADSNQILTIGLEYSNLYKKNGKVDVSKIEKVKKKIHAAILSGNRYVKKNMTDVEKAMVLHDYLVRTTAYTSDSNNAFRLTEVGVFLKHKANCEGYSRAYAILMQKVGIPVKFVSSDKMVHMWNEIKIGKKWYHVDVTWDDPMDSRDKTDQYGRVSHQNFLCSAAKMQKTKHYDFSTGDATGTKYDNRYWKNVNSSFYYNDGKWLYMTKDGITERDSLDHGAATVLYNVAGDNLTQYDADRYYFIAFNSIYLYSRKTNEAKAVWKTTDLYSANCTLDQIKFENNKLYYRVYDNGKHISNKITPKEDGTL